MRLTEGLVRGRSHIVFILALLTAGAIIVGIDGRHPMPDPSPPGSMGCAGSGRAARQEAARWAWSAAARSQRLIDVNRARRLALTVGIKPDQVTGDAPALSPGAGLAVLDALAICREPGGQSADRP